MNTGTTGGFAVVTTADGAIREWLHDDVGFADVPLVAQLFATSSVIDGLAMLREAQQGLLVAPWRLATIDHVGTERDMLVIASRDGDNIVLLGAPSTSEARALLQQVEHRFGVDVYALLLRQLEAAPSGDEADVDTRALIELSLTNNELMGLHRQLMSANAQLRQLDKRKDQLLGMVAHDLRNPLASIAGFASTIQIQLADDTGPNVVAMLGRIERLSQQMLDIVNDLVDVSAIQSNQLTLDVDEVDIAVLVNEVIETYRSAAQQKGIGFTVDGTDAAVLVVADDRRLTQVFDNIVNNAVKYSPADTSAVIHVHLHESDDRVHVAVTDQGAGIPADQHERIFAPFQTAGIAPTGDERSIGLGLPIAKNIVEAHGGAIEVVSEVGVGSTFTIIVPKQSELLNVDNVVLVD